MGACGTEDTPVRHVAPKQGEHGALGAVENQMHETMMKRDSVDLDNFAGTPDVE